MSDPAQPPSPTPPPASAAPPPPASAAPPLPATAAPPPLATSAPSRTSPGDEAAKEVAKVASIMGSMSGTDTLIMGGAALFVIVGDLIFGALLGSGNSSTLLLGFGGVTLAGFLAAEVILFSWVMKPSGGRTASVAPATGSVIVAALVTGVVVLTLGEFIVILRNLGALTDNGIAFLLYELSHWAGAVLMALGLFAIWRPAPKK